MSVGLRQKLLAGIVCVALLMVAAMFVLSETTIRRLLVEKMEKRAVSVGRHVAMESVDPILTGEIVKLQLQAREHERAEDDLEYVYFVSLEGAVIAHSFEGGFPVQLAAANPLPAGALHSIRPIRTKGDVILDVAVPVLGGRLGSVHLGMSEKAVERDVNELLRMVLLVTTLVVAAALLLSLALASIATRPLEGLTRLAGKVAEGSFDERADVRTDDEIGALARAFNTMIDAREAHERDRERLLAELREAVDNVKTLSGFLPICSHCKKIRDDDGYWQQVETYVSQHTGALFSHGICPDCSREVIGELNGTTGKGSPSSPLRK